MREPKDKANTLYDATANGMIACWDHLGMTAQATGRDIGGHRVRKINDAEKAEWKKMVGEEMKCECCNG